MSEYIYIEVFNKKSKEVTRRLDITGNTANGVQFLLNCLHCNVDLRSEDFKSVKSITKLDVI